MSFFEDGDLFFVPNDEEEESSSNSRCCSTSSTTDTSTVFEIVEKCPEAHRLPSIFWNLKDAVEKDPSLRFWCAPMVGGSELAFRLFVRQHGCKITSTPMIIAAGYHRSDGYREQFMFDDTDRPLVVQFATDKPDDFLKAAKLVEHKCDAVELNLGCPQSCASNGHYGSFLMNEPALVYRIISQLVRNVRIPVLVKTRVFNDYADTLRFATMLVDAGVSVLTIHARTRQEGRSALKPARWDVIRRLVDDLGHRCSIVANGNIRERDDALRCLEATRAAAVMSACGILTNPAIFDANRSNTPRELLDNAINYLDWAERYSAYTECITRHLNWSVPPAVLRRSPELTTLMLDVAKSHARSPLPSAVLQRIRSLLVDARPLVAHNRAASDNVCRYFARGFCRNDAESCSHGAHSLND